MMAFKSKNSIKMLFISIYAPHLHCIERARANDQCFIDKAANDRKDAQLAKMGYFSCVRLNSWERISNIVIELINQYYIISEACFEVIWCFEFNAQREVSNNKKKRELKWAKPTRRSILEVILVSKPKRSHILQSPQPNFIHSCPNLELSLTKIT